MIVFMGVAGSGKSVQGKTLADYLALPWLSTGEFLRMLVAGEKRRDMLNGKLLNDKEIITLVSKMFHLIDQHEGFIMDGFPRTTAQADWLLNQVKHGQMRVRGVVHLVANEEVVLKRLLGRGRQDDTEQAIRERFDEYEAQVKPILEHFRSAGVSVFDINADQTPDMVQADIRKALGV